MILFVSMKESCLHKISHQQAIDKARAEYDKYRALTVDEPSPVEQHFIEAIQAVKQLETKHKKGTQ